MPRPILFSRARELLHIWRDPNSIPVSAMIILYILLGLVAAVLLWAVATYNRLVKKRTLVEEGWSGIETQLKRRSNLIPNLVETVKGYTGHERATLERVTELRSQSMNAAGLAERAAVEGQLGQALMKLMAVAENYPDLKASENFKQLQSELSETENQIQLARRYYNGTVRNLNVLVDSFPSNIIAGMFAFTKANFFEIEDPRAREVPQVSFSTTPPAAS
jgi:LemA protein